MEPQNPTVPAVPTPPPQVTPPAVSPVFPKKNNLVAILLSILLLITLLISGYLFLRVQNLTKQLVQLQIQPTPTPLSTETPSPTTDPTANWKTYINTVGNYSIKYPSTFSTEEIAAGGQNEATPTSRSFFIFQTGSSSPYEERYINFETTQLEPSYDQGTITQTVLSGHSAKKIILPNVQFDIYSIKTSNNEFIELYVSSGPTRTAVANQILSTFKFTE